MEENSEKRIWEEENPLGIKPVGGLLRQFAIPSIIALVVNSLYNVVDQVFIGNFIGELGNAGHKHCLSADYAEHVAGTALWNRRCLII